MQVRMGGGAVPRSIVARGRVGVVIRAVSAVVVYDAAGRVLLMRRRDDQTWGLPGGGLEPGETWEQAALRECVEETGWRVRLTGLLGVYSDPAAQTHGYPDGRIAQLCGVVFRAIADRIVGPPGSEASSVRFFHPDDLPEPLFSPVRPILRDALEASDSPFVR